MPDKKEIVLQKCKNAIDHGEPIMDYSFYYEVISLLEEQEGRIVALEQLIAYERNVKARGSKQKA